MKRRTTTIALLLTAALTAAQVAVNYRDREDNLTAVGPGGFKANYKVNGPTTIYLKGSSQARAQIRSKVQGLTLSAGSITAVLTPDRTQRTRSRLSSATATGGVEVIKDVVQNGAHEATEIRSNSATYNAGSAEGRLNLEGSVSIRNVNDAKKQTSVVTGTDGVVVIDPDASGNNPVRTATLSGPVKVNVVEAPAQAGAPQNNFVATGNRLVFNNLVKPATITLSGSVKIVGTGETNLDVHGADQAVIFLNERGEMIEYELTGNPTTTTYRKAGGKG